MNARIVFCLLVFLLGSGAMAQRFSASLQFSSGAALAALAQFEVSYNPISELSIGAKIGLQNSPIGSTFVLQLNPYAYYRILLTSSEVWFLTGFAGLNINFNYAVPSVTAVQAMTQAALPKKDGVDDDPKPVTPIPGTNALGFRATVLAGVDGAWFIDEKNSVYFGFEADLILPPNFGYVFYPYLEYDLQVLDNLTLALGGYVGVGNLFTYNLYIYGFYNLTSNSALRLEVNWNGQLLVLLRWTLRG